MTHGFFNLREVIHPLKMSLWFGCRGDPLALTKNSGNRAGLQKLPVFACILLVKPAPTDDRVAFYSTQFLQKQMAVVAAP